ncbi:MAG: rod shape-determining protein RodA [Candidatus Paceibacterota bacterium]
MLGFVTAFPRRALDTARSFDWILFAAALALSLAGLVTMNSFSGTDGFFEKQIVWIAVSVTACFAVSMMDLRFLRRTGVVVVLYIGTALLLALLFVLGNTFQGSERWFTIGGFSIQPVEPAKVVLIILLAKYFTRRHIEIANIRHILLSGFYAFVLFTLVFLQPDFGSALILFAIWLGMVLVSGISRKHLIALFLIAAVAFIAMWSLALQDYQKARITSFLDPFADIQGSGYNAYQSMVAVGSGEVMGKGIGYGTQSKLEFLPEYQTDFIFAAFAEEWGFVGVLVLFGIYGVLLWRILSAGLHGASNFEILFSLGVAIYFMAHITIHVGMNIGLLPVTGTTIPFMSYGGTHLLTEFTAIGMIIAMRKYRREVQWEGVELESAGAGR